MHGELQHTRKGNWVPGKCLMGEDKKPQREKIHILFLTVTKEIILGRELESSSIADGNIKLASSSRRQSRNIYYRPQKFWILLTQKFCSFTFS